VTITLKPWHLVLLAFALGVALTAGVALALTSGGNGPITTAPLTSGGNGPVATTQPSCHPSYEGACLRVDVGDYDCAGGSGDGPNYVRGPFRVVGPDVFDLDRDRNGLACE